MEVLIRQDCAPTVQIVLKDCKSCIQIMQMMQLRPTTHRDAWGCNKNWAGSGDCSRKISRPHTRRNLKHTMPIVQIMQIMKLRYKINPNASDCKKNQQLLEKNLKITRTSKSERCCITTRLTTTKLLRCSSAAKVFSFHWAWGHLVEQCVVPNVWFRMALAELNPHPRKSKLVWLITRGGDELQSSR
jgi:hypothetical protein